MHGCQVTCISKYHIPGCIVQDSASIRDCIEVHAHYECFFFPASLDMYHHIQVNYNHSLTWNQALGWFQWFQVFQVSQRGRYIWDMNGGCHGCPRWDIMSSISWDYIYISKKKLPSLSHISHHYSHHYPVLYCLVVGLNHPGMESILFFHQIAIRWWILVLIQFHPIYIGTPTATRKNLGPTWTSK